MNYFSTREVPLFPYYTLNQNYVKELDDFLYFLDRSGVADFLKSDRESHYGRPNFNRYRLFSVIIYGFTFGSGSLREIAGRCEYDMRYIYLSQGDTPSYRTIGYFINDYILPKRDEIFGCITRQLLKDLDISIDDVFIDGTKIEADANKYKFVWKPVKWHINLCNKVRKLLDIIGIGYDTPKDNIFSSSFIAKKLEEFMKIIDKEDKVSIKRFSSLKEYLEKALEYEEKEEICGPNRNSYYKTDHDATAMTLKTDYYSGLGSNMHAAYNLQIAVTKGIVIQRYVSQSRSDIDDLIPTVNKIYNTYSTYPKNICADSGYGSYNNYKYLKEHNIKSYVKHQSWQGNVSGKNPSQYTINDDDTITCLNGNIGYQTQILTRHHRYKDTVFYKINGCNECPFKEYCKRFMKNREDNFKIFEINVEYARLKKESEINLLSLKGIEVRVNRSSQVEGVFGSIKYDMDYERLRRTTLDKADTELTLILLGYNIRKLFKHFKGTLNLRYWVSPKELEEETFKKPRANILSRRILKSKIKTNNQIAKNSYKYKHKKV